MHTLNTFFNLQPEVEEGVSDLAQTPEFAQAKETITAELKARGVPPVPRLYEKLVGRLSQALGIDVAAILARGWSKHAEIMQYADKPNPPQGSHLVPLAENSVESNHSLTIQPRIDGEPWGEPLKFDVKLTLKTKGIVLAIRDGKIMEIWSATCVGGGTVEYGGRVILERETSPFKLPVSIVFDEGIPIERLAGPAVEPAEGGPGARRARA